MSKSTANDAASTPATGDVSALEANGLIQDIKSLLFELQAKQAQLQDVPKASDAKAVNDAIAEATKQTHSLLLQQKWAQELEEDEDRIEELKIRRVSVC